MSIINKEIAKSDFDEKVKFHGLEVFTPQQVASYGASIGSLLIKSEKGEDLTEEENIKIKIGKADLNSLKHTTVVDVKEGRIVKSIFYVREPQVKFEDTLEKSESGESVQKGIFLDTPLNKELGRVGETFIKGCAKKNVRKSDEFKTYQEFVKKGISNVYDEMKKAHPTMGDNLYDEIKKASEEKEIDPDEGGEVADTDNKEEGEDEIEKSVNGATEKINENFNKGFIGEESCEVAMKQLDDMIQKARPTKYYKREGSPGSYKYYYTKEQHDKAKGKGKEDGKDKLNPLKRKKFEEAKEIVDGLPYKDKIDSLVSEVKEKYKRPIEHNNKVYQGTIFFEDVHNRIGDLGAFTTPKQKEIKTHITTYVSSKLTMDDYIVHG